MYLVAPALVDDPSILMLPFIERALASEAQRIVLLSSSAVPEGSPGLGVVHQALRALAGAPSIRLVRSTWAGSRLHRSTTGCSSTVGGVGI